MLDTGIGKERVSDIFRTFVESELTVAGFRLTAPTVAERTALGVRQGIYWFGDVDASAPEQRMFAASTFWSFPHELDDGPPEPQRGLERLSGVYPEGVSETGYIDEEIVMAVLRRVVKSNLPLLNRFPDAASLLSEAEKYPRSAPYFLGTDEDARRFNRAYCLETVGRNADAKALYAGTVTALGGKRDSTALLYAAAADRRLKALSDEEAPVPDHPSSGERPITGSHTPVAKIASVSKSNEKTRSVQTQTATALEFLHNAGLSPVHITEEAVVLATNYVCGVLDSRWLDVDPKTILNALDIYSADFRAEKDATFEGGYARFETRVSALIEFSRFSEHCALAFLRIPRKARPKDPMKRYDALRNELKKRGDVYALRVLEETGVRAMLKIEQFVAVLK